MYMVYKFFVRKTKTGSEVRANVNEVLAQVLHKPVIKTFKRIKIFSRFKDIIWKTDKLN